MPSIVTIPPQFIAGFKELHKMSDEDFESLIKGLELAPYSHSVRKLTKSTILLADIHSEEVESVIKSSSSLMGSADKNILIEDAVDDVTRIMKKKEVKETGEFNEDSFRHRLTTLLNNEQLFYAAKSGALLNEQANLFFGAKIMTDIRPIFGRDINEKPSKGVITQSIHIHYRHDVEGEHKDLFLAIDADDIKILKDLIERAEIKAAALRSLMDTAGLTPLNE